MRALGIDRHPHRAVLALLDAGGRSPRVLDTWEVAAGGADDLRESILAHCSEAPDAVGTSVPGGAVSQRILELPFSEASRLAATVPYELEERIPLDIEDSLIAFEVLERSANGGGSQVLAAVAPRDQVASHLEELSRAGLDPAIVDVGTAATTGLVLLETPDAIVLEPRTDGGMAVLRDGRLTGLRLIDVASGDQGTREARWSISALLGGEPPLPVVVAGAEAGLGAHFAEALQTTERPLRDALPAWARDTPPHATRALALAARAAGLVPTGLNFRTGEFEYHPPSEEARRQLYRTGVFAAATAVAGLVAFGVHLSEREGELASLRDRIQAQVATVVKGAPRGTERIRLKGAVESLERRLQMLGGAGGSDTRALDTLLSIVDAVPTEVSVEVEEFSLDDAGVRLRARTDSYESVDVLKQALSATPGASSTEVRDVKTGVDGRVEFRAVIRLGESSR